MPYLVFDFPNVYIAVLLPIDCKRLRITHGFSLSALSVLQIMFVLLPSPLFVRVMCWLVFVCLSFC